VDWQNYMSKTTGRESHWPRTQCISGSRFVRMVRGAFLR